MESSFGSGAARFDSFNQKAINERQLEQVLYRLANDFTTDAEPGTHHPTLLHELWYHLLHDVDGDGKTNVFGVGEEGRGKANDLARNGSPAGHRSCQD